MKQTTLLPQNRRDDAWDKLVEEIAEARKDRDFMREIHQFIRITTS